MRIRSSRVSSRKRLIRPASAAALAAALSVSDPASATSGAASGTTMMISSRSTVICGVPETQPSGSRPASQPLTSAELTCSGPAPCQCRSDRDRQGPDRDRPGLRAAPALAALAALALGRPVARWPW